jgi:competence protein ComEA
MRSRRPSHDQVADVARRRLEQLGLELAGLRDPDVGTGPQPPDRAGFPASPGRPALGPIDPGSPSAPGGEPALTGAGPSGGAVTEAGPGGGSAGSGATAGRHARRPVRPFGTVAAWVRDRVPPGLQDRVALRGAHVAVVAILVVLAAVGTVWWVARADGPTTSLPPVSAPPTGLVSLAPTGVEATPTGAGTAAASPAAGTVPGAATPSGTAHVVVDVAGRVRRPGIATLPLGSRVADALRAAGGARRGVRLGALNLARVLVDGEQILVGVRAPPGPAAAAAAAPTTGTAGPAALVNINTASSVELEALPEVGPVTAQAIVDFRTQNGPFTSVDELLEVSGIGDATLAKVTPFVTL